jgi:hypothetical protein
MKLYKKCLSVAVLLTSSVATNVEAQQIDKLYPQIDRYFEERLKSIDEETNLISFAGSQNIKIAQIEQTKSLIWQRWKGQVYKQYNLPQVEDQIGKTDPPTLHQWELKNEDPMPFYFIRKSTEATNKHALFLNLHGSGPKQMEFKNTLGWTMHYKDAPSIYFIPQIPNERRYRWWYKPVQYAWEKLFRLAMLSEEIDHNKMYVMGISEGGYGSQRLAAFYADYLAGAGPMAGGEPLKNAPPLNFRNIAFSLQTGENDHGFGRNNLTLAAKEEFEKLAAENKGEFVHQIALQPNRGHGIDYTVTTPWLINYSRNPHPQHISWVHFPMHGRYRKGFYNIVFNKPLNIKEGDEFDRAVFDITFQNNTVQLNVDLLDNEMKNKKELEELDISIFLDQHHIDYNKKVKIFLNGKLVFHDKVKVNISNMIESTALFSDSARVFPSKVKITL